MQNVKSDREINKHSTFSSLIAILMMDNSVVDLDAIEALYENVSVLSTLHICMVIRCGETTLISAVLLKCLHCQLTY